MLLELACLSLAGCAFHAGPVTVTRCKPTDGLSKRTPRNENDLKAKSYARTWWPILFSALVIHPAERPLLSTMSYDRQSIFSCRTLRMLVPLLLPLLLRASHAAAATPAAAVNTATAATTFAAAAEAAEYFSSCRGYYRCASRRPPYKPATTRALTSTAQTSNLL